MGDVAFAGFFEDAVVDDGEANDAAEIGFRQAAFLGEVRKGDLAMDGNVRGNVVFVDCLEAYTVQLQPREFCEQKVLQVVGSVILTTGRMHMVGPRRSWWSSRLASRAVSRAFWISPSSIWKSTGPSTWNDGEGRFLLWR